MPAYMIVDIQVTDPAVFDEYKRRVPASIATHGGRYLTRGAPTEVLEGNWRPRRTIILEFPSMVNLKEWWSSPEYQELGDIRKRSADSNIVIVDGS
ncbi:MAG: DUF1330 domain-containing protein [Steroidobacterales bacterium]